MLKIRLIGYYTDQLNGIIRKSKTTNKETTIK